MKRRERDESHAQATSRQDKRRKPHFQNLSQECTIAAEPFAEGSFRFVKRGTYVGGPQHGEPCAVKYFKTGSVYEERFFNEDIKAVNRSKEIITAFNQARIVDKPIHMNEAKVWQHLHRCLIQVLCR